MTPNPQHIARLLYRHFSEGLNAAEQQELDRWLADSPEHGRLLAEAENTDTLQEWIRQLEPAQVKVSANRVFTRIQEGMWQELAASPARNYPRAVHRIHFLKTTWFRYAAAILIFIGLGAGVYLWNTTQHTPALTTIRPVPTEKNDVLPGSDKAVLTLGDGQQVQLDSNASAVLAAKGITNNNALITYSGKGPVNVMNTLSTPKGGQYKLRLPDGTMVWLNAASSITYPTTFSGKDRQVSVTGEAYFEVMTNKAKPFIVEATQQRIEVLGTVFNVNVYANEPKAKTSLLEGSVKIATTILKPGQAYLNGQVSVTDVQQDIAWKNGAFNFTNMGLVAAMRQIERWYDVQVIFEGKIPSLELKGKLPRDFTLNQILAAFGDIGLQYTLKGKQLIISP